MDAADKPIPMVAYGFLGNCSCIALPSPIHGLVPHATLAHPCAAVAYGFLPHATLAHPCAAYLWVRGMNLYLSFAAQQLDL